jgi:hypothetical protein
MAFDRKNLRGSPNKDGFVSKWVKKGGNWIAPGLFDIKDQKEAEKAYTEFVKKVKQENKIRKQKLEQDQAQARQADEYGNGPPPSVEMKGYFANVFDGLKAILGDGSDNNKGLILMLVDGDFKKQIQTAKKFIKKHQGKILGCLFVLGGGLTWLFVSSDGTATMFRDMIYKIPSSMIESGGALSATGDLMKQKHCLQQYVSSMHIDDIMFLEDIRKEMKQAKEERREMLRYDFATKYNQKCEKLKDKKHVLDTLIGRTKISSEILNCASTEMKDFLSHVLKSQKNIPQGEIDKIMNYKTFHSSEDRKKETIDNFSLNLGEMQRFIKTLGPDGFNELVEVNLKFLENKLSKVDSSFIDTIRSNFLNDVQKISKQDNPKIKEEQFNKFVKDLNGKYIDDYPALPALVGICYADESLRGNLETKLKDSTVKMYENLYDQGGDTVGRKSIEKLYLMDTDLTQLGGYGLNLKNGRSSLGMTTGIRDSNRSHVEFSGKTTLIHETQHAVLNFTSDAIFKEVIDIEKNKEKNKGKLFIKDEDAMSKQEILSVSKDIEKEFNKRVVNEFILESSLNADKDDIKDEDVSIFSFTKQFTDNDKKALEDFKTKFNQNIKQADIELLIDISQKKKSIKTLQSEIEKINKANTDLEASITKNEKVAKDEDLKLENAQKNSPEMMDAQKEYYKATQVVAKAKKDMKKNKEYLEKSQANLKTLKDGLSKIEEKIKEQRKSTDIVKNINDKGSFDSHDKILENMQLKAYIKAVNNIMKEKNLRLYNQRTKKYDAKNELCYGKNKMIKMLMILKRPDILYKEYERIVGSYPMPEFDAKIIQDKEEDIAKKNKEIEDNKELLKNETDPINQEALKVKQNELSQHLEDLQQDIELLQSPSIESYRHLKEKKIFENLVVEQALIDSDASLTDVQKKDKKAAAEKTAITEKKNLNTKYKNAEGNTLIKNYTDKIGESFKKPEIKIAHKAWKAIVYDANNLYHNLQGSEEVLVRTMQTFTKADVEQTLLGKFFGKAKALEIKKITSDKLQKAFDASVKNFSGYRERDHHSHDHGEEGHGNYADITGHIDLEYKKQEASFILNKPLSINNAFSNPLGNPVSWEGEDTLGTSGIILEENTEKKSNRKIGNGSILNTV